MLNIVVPGSVSPSGVKIIQLDGTLMATCGACLSDNYLWYDHLSVSAGSWVCNECKQKYQVDTKWGSSSTLRFYRDGVVSFDTINWIGMWTGLDTNEMTVHYVGLTR